MAFSVSPHANVMRGMDFVPWLMHIKKRREARYRAPRRCIYMCVASLYFTTTFFVVPSA